MPMRARLTAVQLLPFRAQKYDFAKMLRELGREGITLGTIGQLCDRSSNAVNDWKNRGVMPRHADGETILALHRKFCGERGK